MGGALLKNKLFINIIYYGLGDFIVTACSTFLLIPLYVSQLDTSEYGILNIINNNTVILTYIFQFGIISAFSRLYFTFEPTEKKKEYINSIMLFHIVYSVFLFAIIYFFFDFLFQNLSPSIKDVRYRCFSVAISFLSFLPALYYGVLRVEHKASKFFIFQVATVAVLLLIITYFFISYGLNLSNILLSQLFTNGIFFVIVTFLLIRTFKIPRDFIDPIKNTLKLSLPIFIGYIAYFFISRYSVIILQKHISLSEIGVYAFSQQISMLPAFLSAVVGKAIQPYLFSSSSEQLTQRVNSIDNTYKLFLIWFTGLIIFFIEDIFKLILPDSYLPAINVSRLLLFVTLIYNITLVENTILLYHMKNKTLLWITIIGSGINLILNNLLVPYFKISGTIMAMFISFSFICFAQIYYSNSTNTKIEYNKKQLFFIFFLFIIFLSLFCNPDISFLYEYRHLYKIISFITISVMLVKALKKNTNSYV